MYKKLKLVINELSKSYIESKRILKEHELGIKVYGAETLKMAWFITDHMEMVANSLEEKYYFIVYNEVLLGKRGDWYLGYISSSTYYRYRKIAYDIYLNWLNR